MRYRRGRNAIDSVSIKLLLRDGAVSVTLEPSLDSDHYDRLLQVAQKVETFHELEFALHRLAPVWGVVGYIIEPA